MRTILRSHIKVTNIARKHFKLQILLLSTTYYVVTRGNQWQPMVNNDGPFKFQDFHLTKWL